jgi:hypothetical protein
VARRGTPEVGRVSFRRGGDGQGWWSMLGDAPGTSRRQGRNRSSPQPARSSSLMCSSHAFCPRSALRSARRHRWRSQGTLGSYRLEIPLDREGLMAWGHGKSRGHRRALQPDHGPLREVRHGLFNGAAPSRVLTWEVCSRGPWLGAFAYRAGHHRLGQINHKVSEHHALRRGAPRPIWCRICSTRTIRCLC